MAKLAEHYGHGLLSLTEIAEAEGLPYAYLERLFASLRQAGLITASRGVQGGYQLARDPAQISVGEVIRILEGPIVLVQCASETSSASCCEREATCTTKNVWLKMRASIAEMLDATSLADICREAVTQGSSHITKEEADG